MYEVYALKYGERDTTACQFFYRESSHAPITLHYFVWLILGGPHPILVDTGFLDDDAQARSIRNYITPAPVVLASGASPCDRNLERGQPVQIITNLPEMLEAFETIHALAGAEKLIVAGHDPEVAGRFTTIEPGIIKIA